MKRTSWSKLLAIALCIALVMPASAPAPAQTLGTSDSENGGLQPWQYTLISVGAGGLIYYFFLRPHHAPTPMTTSRPAPQPSASASTSPGGNVAQTTSGTAQGAEPKPTRTPQDPTDIDGPPVIYGHDGKGCSVRLVDGWMEPTQGVWQDDVVFPDQPTKQLTRDGTTEQIVYDAELSMVAKRDTVITGVDHYLGKTGVVNVRDRRHVVFKVRTNCTTSAILHARFEVRQAVLLDKWDDPHTFQIPIDGAPAEKATDYTISIPADKGLPSLYTFKFESGLSYTILGKLVEQSGAELGLQMRVGGRVVETGGFAVHFVPVVLSEEDLPGLAALISAANDGAANALWINEYFPTAPGAIYGVNEPWLNAISADIPNVGSWSPLNHANLVQGNRNQALLDALTDHLTVQALFENAGRVVAVLTDREFQKTFNTGPLRAGAYTAPSTAKLPGYAVGNNGVRAQTVGSKMIVEPASPSGTATTTTAHELVHTLIPGWNIVDEKQVLPAITTDCKTANYHDVFRPWAFGLRLSMYDRPFRILENARFPIMSYPYGNTWTAQCTYWRLLDTLAGFVVDPPVLLVRGYLAQSDGRSYAHLGPAYDLIGTPSIAHAPPGPYRIVLRDGTGKQLAAYPFQAIWSFSDSPIRRNLVSFAYTVPAPPGVARIDVDSPHGTMESIKRSAAPPAITIRALAHQGKRTSLTWSAPASALASVLYSANGKDFVTEAFETRTGAVTFASPPHGTVKLIVTDGTRSTTLVRRL